MIWGFSHIIISQKMTIADSIKCIFALTRIKHIWFLCCSGGVVDEAEYRRWQRIIPKPPILSAPVTYQTMLRTQCMIHQPMSYLQCMIHNSDWRVPVTRPNNSWLYPIRTRYFFRISKYIGYYRRFLPWGQYTPNMKALKEMPITNHRKVYWSTISA